MSTWPYEAIVTAIERGLIGDWARLTAEIALDPWGEVARQVEEYLAYAEPGGVTALLHRAIVRARESPKRTNVPWSRARFGGFTIAAASAPNSSRAGSAPHGHGSPPTGPAA